MASGIFYPAVSGDDGWTNSVNNLYNNWNYNVVGEWDQLCNAWIRFPDVTIPKGATITEAYIKFTASALQDETICNLNCYFNNSDNAIAPANVAAFNDLVLTGAIAWNSLPTWEDGIQYDTPSLVSVLQDIIDRAGWSSGNALQSVIKNNSSSYLARRQWSSIQFNAGAEKAELHVAWASDDSLLLNPFSATASLQSNIQVEVVPCVFRAEASLSTSTPFWGSYIESTIFTVYNSLQANTEIDITVTPLVAQAGLQSNIQIELASGIFTAQSELSVGEIFWGYTIPLLDSFSANASLQVNTQIETVLLPLTATVTLQSNIGIEISAGSLSATGMILSTPVYPIILTDAKRVYIFTLTGAVDGVEDIVIPIKSFQSRLKSGDPTYLSVVIPGIDYASAINLRLNGDLVVRMGYLSGGEIILSEIISMVYLENITIYNGTTNKSITIDGHITQSFTQKEINLTGASYKNLTSGKLRYRCTPDLYLRPGDIANINNDSFTVENITHSVSAELETFEVSE